MFYGELSVFAVFAAIASLMIWHYYSIGSWALDKSLANFMDSIRSLLLDKVFRFITATGESLPVIIATLVVVILFIYLKHKKEAALMALYMLSVWLLNELLKSVIERPRPAVSMWLVQTTGSSMPSGHSMNGMAFLLISVYFIWFFSRNRKLNAVLSIVLPLYAILIGLSRVYLHVHYISDVITGWSLGAACAAVGVMIHRLWMEGSTDKNPLINK